MQNKKANKGTLWGILLTIITITGLVLGFMTGAVILPIKAESVLNFDTFKEQADVEEIHGQVGTNIRLHQEIHGERGITYRYKLETDCPTWKYEDRYESSKILDWVGKNSAVETEACSLSVSFQGKSLAAGQHFYVPLLGLNQDDIPYTEYKEQMLEQAYSQYKQGQTDADTEPTSWIKILIIGCCIILLIPGMSKVWNIVARKKGNRKDKEMGKGTEKAADKTAQVLAIIEQFLAKRSIRIPDSRRMGELDEACLFGESYEELEEKIHACLQEPEKED